MVDTSVLTTMAMLHLVLPREPTEHAYRCR